MLHKKDKESVTLVNGNTCDQEVQVSLTAAKCDRCQFRRDSNDDDSSDKLVSLIHIDIDCPVYEFPICFRTLIYIAGGTDGKARPGVGEPFDHQTRV